MAPLSRPLMASFRKRLAIAKPFEAVTSIAIGYPKGKIDRPVKRNTPPVDRIRQHYREDRKAETRCAKTTRTAQ
ncbi:MAG: hypothetical protein M0036_22215 [Desulfobacteraceae bacterium]|nr:hypothetical protein [Desulfobacteraceae bacterium]